MLIDEPRKIFTMRRLLPPVLFIASALLMLLLHHIWPVILIVSSPYHWSGLLLTVSGLGISAWHNRLFNHVGTNIYTFDEPGVMVTEGMFRITRNPMYLGFVLALTGLAVLLGTLTPPIVVLLFFIITDRWYITFEEEAMQRKFGDLYLNYQRRVRRWI
jgi:protein-S-isoprenylcysteine O-methyltransferase Ste14